jgi:hypothetical protein
MNIFELAWEAPQQAPGVIEMRRVRCLCHFKEIWVPRWEAHLPVFCERKELPPCPEITV